MANKDNPGQNQHNREELSHGRRRIIGGLGALGATTLLSGCQWTHSQAVQNFLSRTQYFTEAATGPISSPHDLAHEYSTSDISPHFRKDGTVNPQNPAYQKLAANQFDDYRLAVTGLVEHPASYSLAQIKAMPSRTQITRHDCVEGWSCIAQWTGVILGHLLDRVKPKRHARYVVFHCADHLLDSSQPYYESLNLAQASHPQTLLAYGMNGHTLPVAYGAPIRLRAPLQLGYKSAKYVMRLELVESFANIQGGKGGFWEDRGYNWWAGI